MSAHELGATRVERLAETTLFVLGEERVILGNLERLEHLLEGLEEADRLEVADAQGQLEEAITRHSAARARLKEVEHRAEKKAQIHARIRQCIKQAQTTEEEGARTVTADAVAAGFAYARPELLPCLDEVSV